MRRSHSSQPPTPALAPLASITPVHLAPPKSNFLPFTKMSKGSCPEEGNETPMNYQGNNLPIPHWPSLPLHIMKQLHVCGNEITKMGNLRLRRASKKKDTVGRFKPDGRCKKHFKHRQSPGVCSLCLREKLTQLSIPSSRTQSSASHASSSSSSSVSSLSSYHSSSSASSCASPMHHFPFTSHANNGTSHSSLVSSVFWLNAKHGLTNSRSVAVGGSKKAGFWYRLLHPNQNIIQDLH